VCLGNKNHLHSSYPGSAMMASLIWWRMNGMIFMPEKHMLKDGK
jgi:hypothetical protein